MWSSGSRCPRQPGVDRDAIRRHLASFVVLLFCFALVPGGESTAQTAPWDIEDIQRRLTDVGYVAGEADGRLGPRTRAALRAFQADRGLEATGLPNGETVRALRAADPAEAQTGSRPPVDDPPRLEAVPLKPVQVAPLPPLRGPGPHEGASTEVTASGVTASEEPRDTPPPLSKGQGLAIAPKSSSAEPGPWEGWIAWGAAALLALGALAIFAAVQFRPAKPERPGAVSPGPVPAKRPATLTGKRGGHVYGIDIPPPGNPEPG